ncbi:hypothetical protein [Roseicella aquatilis]|uniref:Glycosyl transferase n=1 Tax=Roseicella aquatilis TaxID=2527868 RepID=A0A4R4DKH6_9PROT|nr:hypothetical protein [Roseicella aquatilis]TCZ60916.1 hypothetical protein EXY23_14190 [Roseicella aquatilis]
MSEVHCFTSASFAYLDRVRVLAETLRRHHPDWKLWFCLVDEEPPGFAFDPAEEQIDGVVRISELDLPPLKPWMFKHDVVELCTAVKGAMLCRLLDGGADKVVYLDPDIAVFGSMADMIGRLDQHDVVLTPHQVEPDDDVQAIHDNEIGSLKWGIYNLGFLAVAGTANGRRFARWWRDRLFEHCYDEVPEGLFTDQKWCDLAPALFDGVHVLRDPGYNVASWNLSRRRVTIGEDGVIRAGAQPLRFFHFTKVTASGEVMLERYAGGRVEIFELMHWYRSRLAAHRPANLPKGWWAFGHYADGTPVPRAHRRKYRDRSDLQARYPDPFAAGSAAIADG